MVKKSMGVEKNLKRANVSPQVKKDKLLSQFLVIKDTKAINVINENLKKTPLRHFTEFLYENIYKNIKYIHSSEDYLGRFYGEFMSYSGGDGQSLGIILTPKHITELFCDLVELKPTDSILDPCCGTAGFLIAGMHEMVQKADNVQQKRNIRKPITSYRISTLYVHNCHNKYDFTGMEKVILNKKTF